jgi:glycosyltransferase involved in cell wall biosynthesis
MTNKIVIFYFSSIRYEFLHQRPQKLFREWRSHFEQSHKFYYVDPPDKVRFVTRTLEKAKRSLQRRIFNNQEAGDDDARILTWMPLPFTLRGHRLPVFDNFLSLPAFDYRKTLEKCCGKTQKKVAIVADAFWEPYITKAEFDVICYDCIDALETHPTSELTALRKKQEKLINKSDVVFVTATKLKEDILSIAKEKQVITVSNGVDTSFFESNKDLKKITDYHRRNSKIVGYIGVLAWWVDIDLIYAAAQRLNDVDFLLIGPFHKQGERSMYDKPENVFTLGAKEYNEIPAYIDMLDVGLIPFKSGPISESTDPVKLYEYFSLGKPVVTTYLRQLEKLDNGSLLRMTKTTEEFIEAITFFLMHDMEPWQVSRKLIAQQNSWYDKASTMVNFIESRIREGA